MYSYLGFRCEVVGDIVWRQALLKGGWWWWCIAVEVEILSRISAGDGSEIETRETDTKTRDPLKLAKTLAELSISRFEIAS